MAITDQDRGLIVTVVLNGAVALACIILFPFFKKRYKDVYEPRCSNKKTSPKPPHDGFIAWFFSTYFFTEEDVYLTAGLDALMYIRFTKLIFRIVLFQALYSFIILIPINATGSNKNLPIGDPLRVQGLAIQSMSNIPQKSSRLWAHLVNVFYISIVTLVFIYHEIKVYLSYRLRYKKEPGFIENYTSAITEIPRKINKDNGLRLWFAQNYPNWIIMDLQNTFHIPYLDKKYGQREEVGRKYEKAQHHLNIKSERPQTRTSLCGKKVDAIDHYRSLVYKKDQKIELHKQIVHDRTINPIAFVTFDSIQTQAICSQVALDHNMDIMIPKPCPEPRAIKWENTNIRRSSHLVRSIIVYAATFFLVFFWLIPVTFVMILTNLSFLASVSWLSWINTFLDAIGPVVSGFIQGLLPVIILAVFMSVILPLILMKMTEAQGYFSRVKIEISFFEKLFVFNLFNTFLGAIIAGSIFNFIQRAISNPGIVIPLLATSVPRQAFFFTNFVILYAFFTLPFYGLLRVVDWIVYHIKTKISGSLRDAYEAKNFGPFPYAKRYGTDILMFLIIITYSTMYPFILVFGFLYAAFSFIITKYNLCFVVFEEFRMGGLFFPKTITKLIYTLIFYQVVMFAILLGFEFYFTALIGLVLVPTIGFRIFVQSYFDRVERFCSYDQFASKDSSEIVRPFVGEVGSPNSVRVEDLNQRDVREVELDIEVEARSLPFKDAYRQPTLKDPEEHFQVGEYGEFNYQTEDIRGDFDRSEMKIK